MAFYSAKNAKVRINDGTVAAKQWTVTPEVDEIDVTSFEAGGNTVVIPGCIKHSIEIVIDEDGSQNLLTSSIAPGSYVTLKLYLNGTGGPYWSFPIALVRSQPMRAGVREAMGTTISLTASAGTWAYPSGNASS
jgi:hypothetical protein